MYKISLETGLTGYDRTRIYSREGGKTNAEMNYN